MNTLRVTPSMAAKIREQALRGDSLFSLCKPGQAVPEDAIAVILESKSSELPVQYQINVATSRLRPAQHSPVTTWRPDYVSSPVVHSSHV